MARKRESLRQLDYQSKEYWNKLLNEEGLSMDSGKSNKLLYVGGSSEIEVLEGSIRTSSGRTAPKGSGPASED